MVADFLSKCFHFISIHFCDLSDSPFFAGIHYKPYLLQNFDDIYFLRGASKLFGLCFSSNKEKFKSHEILEYYYLVLFLDFSVMGFRLRLKYPVLFTQ